MYHLSWPETILQLTFIASWINLGSCSVSFSWSDPDFFSNFFINYPGADRWCALSRMILSEWFPFTSFFTNKLKITVYSKKANELYCISLFFFFFLLWKFMFVGWIQCNRYFTLSRSRVYCLYIPIYSSQNWMKVIKELEHPIYLNIHNFNQLLRFLY